MIARPLRALLTFTTLAALSVSCTPSQQPEATAPPPVVPSDTAEPAPAPSEAPPAPVSSEPAPDAGGAAQGALCNTDQDCVPAACCHAKACVPRHAAPQCDGVMCTMECRPETLDCGGGCLCKDGRCEARFGKP